MDKKNNKQQDFSLEREILTSYLSNYRPYTGNGDCVYMTSQQISDDMSEMAWVNIEDIARFMYANGYKVGLGPDHRPAWMISRV